MKLTYATDFDATNINKWSGLGYYYGIMLKNAGFDLGVLNNMNPPFPSIHLVKQILAKRLAGEIYSPRFNMNVSKTYARIIKERTKAGAILFSPNTVVLANVKVGVKRVLYADATFERLINFYPNYGKLSESCLIDGHEIDRLAIHNCDMLIYSSQWAAESAINYYKADPDKVFVAPYGANLDIIPDFHNVKSIIQKRCSSKEMHLLFLGVDWKRKGGDLALEVKKKLEQKGLKVFLHIVGIKDELSLNGIKDVINHGFIRKDTVHGQEKLAQLFSLCNFLILPTMADCTPVSFSEANAYGLPCITTDVGGNSCIIKNNINGKAINIDSFIPEASHYIAELMDSTKLYEDLCLSSYDKYHTELNWTTTGNKIYKLINSM